MSNGYSWIRDVCRNDQGIEWKKGELGEVNIRRVSSIVRKECCNCRPDGTCILLDDVDSHRCPQIQSKQLLCRFARNAVIPIDPALMADLVCEGSTKNCVVCGVPFIPRSNRMKYCPRCAVEVRRRKHTERVRKQRSCDHLEH